MFTTDDHLSTRGDCIIAIGATKGLGDLDPELRDIIRKRGSRVTVTVETMGKMIHVRGEGHPDLELSHPCDIVIRKSRYTCDRTLMIGADIAAFGIPQEFVELLRDTKKDVSVKIRALCDT